ncbi:MAG: aminotransferase class V-fold PLP-dependent enzyme [Polyangiaceae bacterium]
MTREIASLDPTDANLPTWQLSASRAAVLLELERRVHRVLSTYSNVHRGSGHHSRLTTALYEHARRIVLEHLGLDEKAHTVIFTNPHGAEVLATKMDTTRAHVLSSQTLGLPLGVRAVAIPRRELPSKPLYTGGGTARLVSPNSAILEDAPERFEAGTPAIVNVITFACALRISRRCGATILAQTTGPTAPHALESTPDEFPALQGLELMTALRETMIGRRTSVPVEDGTRAYVHLDNAASTLTFLAVWNVVRRAWGATESSQAELIGRARRSCTRFVGADPKEYAVIFTSNATEAINTVATSLGFTGEEDAVPVVLNTLLEHNSNELPWRRVTGMPPVRLNVDSDGFIALEELEARLREYNVDEKHGRKRIRLVAVSGASNVLGSYNDLDAICHIAHRYGARVLVDGAQLAPHRRIDMTECGIDYLVLSGHKTIRTLRYGSSDCKKGTPASPPPLLGNHQRIGRGKRRRRRRHGQSTRATTTRRHGCHRARRTTVDGSSARGHGKDPRSQTLGREGSSLSPGDATRRHRHLQRKARSAQSRRAGARRRGRHWHSHRVPLCTPARQAHVRGASVASEDPRSHHDVVSPIPTHGTTGIGSREYRPRKRRRGRGPFPAYTPDHLRAQALDLRARDRVGPRRTTVPAHFAGRSAGGNGDRVLARRNLRMTSNFDVTVAPRSAPSHGRNGKPLLGRRKGIADAQKWDRLLGK